MLPRAHVGCTQKRCQTPRTYSMCCPMKAGSGKPAAAHSPAEELSSRAHTRGSSTLSQELLSTRAGGMATGACHLGHTWQTSLPNTGALKCEPPCQGETVASGSFGTSEARVNRRCLAHARQLLLKLAFLSPHAQGELTLGKATTNLSFLL